MPTETQPKHTPGLTMRAALNAIIEAEEGWSGSDFTRSPTGISKIARHAIACANTNACEGINPEAVPDLLAALRAMVDADDAHWPIATAEGVRTAARAAIAKATH